MAEPPKKPRVKVSLNRSDPGALEREEGAAGVLGGLLFSG